MKSTTFLMLIFFTLFSSTQEGSAQSKKSKLSKETRLQIEQLLTASYDKETTGVSVLISKEGKIVYERQLGLANVNTNKRIKKSTRFNIGSITKQFTAAAILQLQEQGKLKVSDYLGIHLKAFSIEKYPITIEHLLTHTSGLPSKGIVIGLGISNASEITIHENVSTANAPNLVFMPGEEYQYSNNGYILLGLIIEKVSGKSYKEYVDDHIFSPLKMNRSTVSSNNDGFAKKAIGYELNDNDELSPANPFPTFSAGDIVSTPRDMNKWVTGLFSHKIINTSSLSAMLNDYQLHNGTNTHYGYGWEFNKIQNTDSYEHSGSTPGFKANSIYVPEENLYVIVMQNNEEGSPRYPTIQIASTILGKPYPLSTEAKMLTTSELGKFIGTYTLENGDKRYIDYNEETGLFYKAPGGRERKLYAHNDRTLSFRQGYVSFTFSKDSEMGYQEFVYQNRITKSTALKTAKETPKKNEVISVDSERLKTYTGTYVSEQMTITISLENGQLLGQPKGSDALELKPKGDNKFFIEEIGAEIEFTKDGNASYINILLEGEIMQGVKVL